MRKLYPTLVAYVIASIIGGVLTLIAFTLDAGKASNALDVAIVPGTIVYLLISGGEAGSTPIAEAIAPYAAGLVNMICYPLVLLIIFRIYRRLTGVMHHRREQL
jgi:hypothetical protein